MNELQEEILPRIQKWIQEYKLSKYRNTTFLWEKISIYGMLWNYIVITEKGNILQLNNFWDFEDWDQIVLELEFLHNSIVWKTFNSSKEAFGFINEKIKEVKPIL